MTEYETMVEYVQANVVDDRSELQDLADGGDVTAFDENVLVPNDGLRNQYE